jgi:hypothetical protein
MDCDSNSDGGTEVFRRTWLKRGSSANESLVWKVDDRSTIHTLFGFYGDDYLKKLRMKRVVYLETGSLEWTDNMYEKG